MKTILVCEDEVAIRDFVVINLTYAGFQVIEVGSAEEALERFDSSVDMALLDIMLPGMDGLTLCRTLREKSEDMGIIMLSARTQEQEKIDALRMGADDYVTKPFSPSELIARIEALYRRVAAAREQKQPVEEICSGSFVLNARMRTVTKNDRLLDLTQVEYQMLYFFFQNPDRPLDRTEILRHVWGDAYIGAEKIVDVNVRRLRIKIEDDPSAPAHIRTVWGHGYQWSA